MSTSTDADDWDLLRLANEKGKFALSIGVILLPAMQWAFERGIDEQWFTLVDIAPLQVADFQMMRVFRLTEAGWKRRRELVPVFATRDEQYA